MIRTYTVRRNGLLQGFYAADSEEGAVAAYILHEGFKSIVEACYYWGIDKDSLLATFSVVALDDIPKRYGTKID